MLYKAYKVLRYEYCVTQYDRRQISELNSSWTPGVFYTYLYNHAHRLRLENLLYVELSRSSNGYFQPLLDPGGGFRSETAVTRYITVSEVKRLKIYNGYM